MAPARWTEGRTFTARVMALCLRWFRGQRYFAVAFDPAASVFGLSGQSIGRRFSAAAKRAGYRATAHSARVTYASELTRLGASTTEVMQAGAWKTARMVAHCSAGVAAEDNATAKYL